MKVFWSWQSDSPGKISRFFIRDCLDEVINELKKDLSVEDSDRPDELHLDHDRKGVPGSPDLIPVILGKIDESLIFVADVSTVATIAQGKNSKHLINSNVAIELGYALKSIGDRRILMVMNRHYGEIEDLPFDLRHKAGCLVYTLAPNSSNDDIRTQRAQLKGQLRTAIGDIVRSESVPSAISHEDVSWRLEPKFGLSLPFPPGIAFCHDADSDQDIRIATGSISFLRVAATRRLSSLTRVRAMEIVRTAQAWPLAYDRCVTGSFGRSSLGAFSYWFDPPDSSTARSLVLLSLNGEFWSVATGIEMLSNNVADSFPSIALERHFAQALDRFSQTLRTKLNAERSVWVHAGIEKLQGIPLNITQHGVPTQTRGAVDSHVDFSGEYSGQDQDAANKFLVPLFEKLWDSCEATRPPNLQVFRS